MLLLSNVVISAEGWWFLLRGMSERCSHGLRRERRAACTALAGASPAAWHREALKKLFQVQVKREAKVTKKISL